MNVHCIAETRLLRREYDIDVKIDVKLRPYHPPDAMTLSPQELNVVARRLKAKIEILIEGYLRGLEEGD